MEERPKGPVSFGQESVSNENTPPFLLLHINSSSIEFSEADLAPHELVSGGICICLQGKSLFTFNQKRCYLQKGDLCVFFPHMLLQIDSKSEDFEAYCIISNIDLTSEIQVPSSASLFLYIKDHPCISLDDETFRRMTEYCRLLSEFEQNGHPYREQVARHLMMLMYYEIFDIYQHGNPLVMSAQTRQETMFRQFINLVAQNYVNQREIGFYADQLCVTPKYLSSVVRSVSGKSAAWWINHTVILHAKNLLKSNLQLTIQQISDKLNFPNPSFFGQYFKRRVGMTPKEFRRETF